MATIRELVKEFIADHDNPSTIIGVNQLREEICETADKPDIEKAIKFYQQNAFTNAMISLGYYRSGEDTVSNDHCEDLDRLRYIAFKANSQLKQVGKRYKRFGKKVNEMSGQRVFDVDESNSLTIKDIGEVI